MNYCGSQKKVDNKTATAKELIDYITYEISPKEDGTIKAELFNKNFHRWKSQ